MNFPIERVRADFPLLSRQVNGQPLVYLDSAASAQKPQAVIDKELHFYRDGYAAVHRGIHSLSAEATQQMEAVRTQVADFIHAASAEEIIFVRGTTEAINLVANSYGRHFLARVIVLSLPKWNTMPILCLGRCWRKILVLKSVFGH